MKNLDIKLNDKQSKLILTFILFFIYSTASAQLISEGRQLAKSYKEKSYRHLQLFFDNWYNTVPTINSKDFSNLNDTLKNAYNVFTAFYQPLNIQKLGGSEWGDNIYNKTRYLIIQNSIKIYKTNDKIYYSENEIDSATVKAINESNITDSVRLKLLKRKNGKLSAATIERFFSPYSSFYEMKADSVCEIKDFRPLINCGDKIPLYLIKNYDVILNAFLGNTHLPLGAGGIMNPARSVGESAKRQKFLEKYIKIWYGHWGGYWQLNSYPEVTSVIFDKDMNYAKVEFRMIYEGGETILKNDHGKWSIISSKRTWIE